MQHQSTPIGGSGINRPKTTIQAKREKGKERRIGWQQNLLRKPGANIRCNTDQETPKKRTRDRTSEKEMEKPHTMETTRPQAAIIEGRKKKEQRETKKITATRP